MNIFILTLITMMAFAGNSVLCRIALGNDMIDAQSFTLIRLISGALALYLLVFFFDKGNTKVSIGGSWLNGLYLYLYAIGFSLAYVYLDTGTGALILFATVQLTMLTVSLVRGEKLSLTVMVGVISSFIGFVWLMLPGASQPNLLGFVLMLLAGLAWAGYTLGGRESGSPLIATKDNFIRASLLALVSLIWFIQNTNIDTFGVFLALLSGILASGAGYALWYSVVKRLSRLSAGIVQLSVPVIAALGGFIFMNEQLTFTFILSSTLILFGISLVVYHSSKEV